MHAIDLLGLFYANLWSLLRALLYNAGTKIRVQRNDPDSNLNISQSKFRLLGRSVIVSTKSQVQELQVAKSKTCIQNLVM